MTKSEFIDKCKALTVGTIALGSSSFRKIATGPIESLQQAGQVLNEIDTAATQLLGKLYEVLHSETKQAVPNGRPVTTEKPK